jgi:hypothetical protein
MDQAGYYWTHPPRCLDGFTKQRARLGGVTFNGHGEDVNTVFRLQCTCGHGKQFVLGHFWQDPDAADALVFLSPLALRCEACAQVAELFDSGLHGYEAELGGPPVSKRGEGERADFPCPRCGVQPFEVFARFEYPGNLFEDDSESVRGREQELFSWFTLVGICPGCTRLVEIADFECA